MRPDSHPTPAAEQPAIQAKLDYINSLGKKLAAVLDGVDQSLDRLTNRAPQPVPPMGNAEGTAVRASVEGALNAHASHLEACVRDAESILNRINRAI